MNKESQYLTVKTINVEISKIRAAIKHLNNIIVEEDYDEYSPANRKWLFEQTEQWLNSYIRELEDYSVVPS